MTCVHRTPDRSLAQLLCGALTAEGVGAMVEGEHLAPLQGLAIPAGPSAEFRVCVVDPDQTPRARLLVAEWLAQRASAGVGARWRCACGETHESQFSSCWRCGAEQDA